MRGLDASCNTSDPSGVITPSCLQDLYGISATPATQKNKALLVTGYDNEFAEMADLSEFLTQFRPDMSPNTTFTLSTTDNGTNPQGELDRGPKASLDIQYTTGLATDVPIQFLFVGATDFPTGLVDTITFLQGLANPPTVVTTSYGNDESHFGASVAIKIYDGFMAPGARGISIIFASGDGGVRGGHDDRSECNSTVFEPVFPAGCRFVTSMSRPAITQSVMDKRPPKAVPTAAAPPAPSPAPSAPALQAATPPIPYTPRPYVYKPSCKPRNFAEERGEHNKSVNSDAFTAPWLRRWAWDLYPEKKRSTETGTQDGSSHS
ncbi:Family S53 protease-like protein [Mycena venus]|uniref:Family S53 protease-like protein n=1 Tax=Mycena venus TaxID=2733690 RepID=A0A8H6XXR3_9AGAR|nr:Family S53 protease-like protein [Mycena venus]